MKPKTDPINDALYAALAKHFSEADWWLVYEVGLFNGAQDGGDSTYRRADAFAICTWASRSWEIHGIEVKATRSDWLAELREPAKADAAIRICRKWWVCAPPDVVKEGELPEGWGLLVPSNGGLREQVKAKARDDIPEPPRGWWVRVLRQVGHGKTIRKRIDAAYAAGERAGQQGSTWRIESERDRAKQAYESLQGKIAEFQKFSGLDIDTWAVGDIGKAVRVVLASDEAMDRAVNFLSNVQRATKDLEKALVDAGRVIEA